MFTGFYLFAIWNIFWPITIFLIRVEIEIFSTLHFKCCAIITLFIFSRTPNDLWRPEEFRLRWLKTFLIELCTFWMLIKSICFVRAKVSISNTRRYCWCCRWFGHKCPRTGRSWSGRNRFMCCGGWTITESWVNWNISTSIKLFLWSKTKTRSIFVWSPTVR